MKQVIFFAIALLFIIMMSCGREYSVPGQYTTIPGFVRDSMFLYNNNPIKDSLLADFDNDGIADLSITGYKYILGASALLQENFFRLNTLNPDYAILSEIQSDTICSDTTISGQIMSTYTHNCSSPNGSIVTGTYAVSSNQYLTPPAGIYNSGMLTIYQYLHLGAMMGSPTSTYDKSFGNKYNGYFFIKHVTTNNIYALKLQYKDMYIYIMEDIIRL